MRVVGVVLAAGRATRFGATKVLAPLEGRPLLAHVLERLATAGIGDVVVVLGDEAAAIEASVDWPAGTMRVVNPDPSRGLASSLALGVAAARHLRPEPDAVLVALGDQPRVDPSVVAALIAAADAGRPLVVPRYPDATNPNPVLVLRGGFDLVAETSGDRGLGPLIARRPELVREIVVAGANPDIDTPGDLRALDGAAGATSARSVRHPVA
jgi:molybdenum cofactor cytidylyltransferase